ncbi:hypothetical protein ABPG73_010021 [Tetrahymena malaccensis]
MDQHFSEMNNLRNSYCDVLCQQYNYHPVYYQNSQEFFHKTDNFQSYNHSKDHFFSNDYAILEPEYFLNIQNIDESKVIEELTLPSNNHDSFISQFSQSHQQCFNEYNRDEQKILTQNDNDGNSLFHQLQQQQELGYSNQQALEVLSNNSNNQQPVNTQNCLKNIVYAFLSRIKQMKKCKILNMKDSQFQNMKKQLIRYMKHHSFNQQVINYLVTHKIYKQLLLNYLDNESSVWLNKSKVIDKQEVNNQIKHLKNCIRDVK